MKWGWLLLFGAVTGCAGAPKKPALPPEKAGVKDAVTGHVGDVSDCYTAALKRNPKLNGKLILEWEVNPIGDSRDIKVVQGVEPKLDQCVVKKVSGWAFPIPPDGKVMKVRYPFTFNPVETPQAAAAMPAPGKKCPQIESEYAQLCVRDENSGECILDEKQTGEMLQLLRTSPKFEPAYLAEIDKLLKNPRPTPKEAEAIVAKLTEDCWTDIHQRMWASMFHTFKNVPTHSRRAEAKEVLAQRTTGLEVHPPTLVTLSRDVLILDGAIDSGFVAAGPQAKKQFGAIRAAVKALVRATHRDWNGPKAKVENDMLPPAHSAADPEKLVKLVRKELKAVKPLRGRLKDWSKRYWKKF